MNEIAKSLGTKIQVVGPSCSGKTTLAAGLGQRLGLEFLELDALFWKPNWTEPDAAAFAQILGDATAGDRWIAAGNYIRHTVPLYWSHLDTVVWLDFPLRVTIPRVVLRSWKRWRQKEHLWGTNYERFWDQLKVWSPKDSLIAYNVRRGGLHRERFLAVQADQAFAHLQWVRLRNPKEVERWLATIE